MGWVEDNTSKDPIAKVGMRIRMLNMGDEQDPIDDGLEGTIVTIDDLGTLHVKWDDGRKLGVIPNIDEYQLLPPEDEQIDFDIFEEKDFKPTLTGAKSTPLGKEVTKNFKSAFSNSKVKDIKIESEEVPGGEAEGMTAKDLAKKHGVSVKDIEKEIEVGTKIEMEHTDSKKMAKEIAMDHIAEFPDYYTNKKYGVKASEKGLEGELEETTTTGALGASPIQPLGSPIRKPKAKETSSYVITKGDLKNPLGKVYSLKSESKVIKVKDLLSEITNSGSIKSTSDFLITNLLGWADLRDMSPPWPSKNHLADNKQHEDWWWQKTPTYNDGVITDPYAKTNEVWDDEELEVTIDQDLEQFRRDIDKNKKNYEKRITTVGKAFDVNVDTTGIRWANYDNNERNIVVSEAKKKKSKESPIHTKKWERCVKDVKKKNEENNTDYNPYAVCQKSIGYEGSIKKPHRRKEKEDLEETTTFSSVFGGGFPVTPFMFAKKGKHIPSKKTLWPGGTIVQKADKADLLGEGNTKLFNEVNKVKWVKGGKFVKIKDKCAKYNNKPWCSQGAIDNPIELSDNTFENIKKVSKKMNISEGDILDKIKAKLKRVSKEQMEYNKEHGLPIWWQGSKEGFYDYMEPRKNNTGSN